MIVMASVNSEANMNQLIDQFSLANALLEEGLPLQFQESSYQNKPTIELDENFYPTLKLQRLVHYTEKLYPSVYTWLLHDPRTVVSSGFLSIVTKFQRESYCVQIEITIPLEMSDKQCLQDLGKIRTESYNYETLVC